MGAFNPVNNLGAMADERTYSHVKAKYGLYDSVTNSRVKERTLINKLGKIIQGNEMSFGKAYCFFTKPDLNLFQDTANITSKGIGLFDNVASLFSASRGERRRSPLRYTAAGDANFMNKVTHNKEIAAYLDSVNGPTTTATPFIPILSNRVSGFNLQDVNIETTDSAANGRGVKLKYALHGKKSVADNSISISFTDNRWRDVYTLIDIHTDYMTGARLGEIVPRKSTLLNGTLDYAHSIFIFHTLEDGETINFWAKYSGVYPLMKPSGSFDVPKGRTLSSPIEYSVTYYAVDFKAKDYNTVENDFNLCYSKTGTLTSTAIDDLINKIFESELDFKKWKTINAVKNAAVMPTIPANASAAKDSLAKVGSAGPDENFVLSPVVVKFKDPLSDGVIFKLKML